ncbi:MAG: hypothetical protein QXR62_05320 [Candidatus Bathyarchaeia archaeon]
MPPELHGAKEMSLEDVEKEVKKYIKERVLGLEMRPRIRWGHSAMRLKFRRSHPHL